MAEAFFSADSQFTSGGSILYHSPSILTFHQNHRSYPAMKEQQLNSHIFTVVLFRNDLYLLPRGFCATIDVSRPFYDFGSGSSERFSRRRAFNVVYDVSPEWWAQLNAAGFWHSNWWQVQQRKALLSMCVSNSFERRSIVQAFFLLQYTLLFRGLVALPGLAEYKLPFRAIHTPTVSTWAR